MIYLTKTTAYLTPYFAAPTFLNIYFSEREQNHAYLFYRDVHDIFNNDGFTRNGKDQQYGMVARVCHVRRILDKKLISNPPA